MIEYRMDEIFELQMGKTPSRGKQEYWVSKGHKWISIADLSKCSKYISETKEYLSDEAVNESGISLIPANTVLLSFKLSIGKVAITAEPMYSNEAIMSFRDRQVVELLPEYIYYMFLGKDWDSGTNKAVMGKTLNKATLSAIRIKVHDISKQREIVRVLSKVDELIVARQQQLAKLDELVKARFVEMFGDPFLNLMNWNKIKIANAVTVEPQNGMYKPQSNYVTDGTGTPILRIDSFYDGEVTDFSLLKRLVCNEEEKQKYALREDDIIINRVNSIEYLGKCARITGLKEETVYESNMMRMHFDSKRFNPIYIIQLLCSQFIYRQIVNHAKKAVNQASINQKDVLDFDIYEPPIELQNTFGGFVKQTEQLKLPIQKSIEQMETLKKALMQQYFG